MMESTAASSQPPASDCLTRAELYLCLGQALMPPLQQGARDALGSALAADLDELLPAGRPGTELGRALQAVPDDQALLRAYSRLFLVPPYPAPLNAGLYLDKSIMGPSVVEMERFYQRHGLARDLNFRDMPDHLALQLQFLALLFGSAAQAENHDEYLQYLSEARDFLNRFMRPWPNDWVHRLHREVTVAPHCAPYKVLGEVIRDALDQDARWLQSQVPVQQVVPDGATEVTPLAAHSGTQAACATCHTDFIPTDGLSEMIKVLEQQELDAAHLAVCPDCRANAMGFETTTPDFKEARHR